MSLKAGQRIDLAAARNGAAVLTTDGAANDVRQLALDQIRLDGDTQPRGGIDWKYVEELVEALAAGATLPAVKVTYDGAAYWLHDGFHRWHAHSRSHRTTIAASVQPGTLADAQWASLGANKDHGLRRTTADKERAIRQALRHPNAVGMSNAALGRHLGVSDKTVDHYRKEMETTSEIPKSDKRTGADGRTIDVSNIGAKPKPPPAEQPSQGPPAPAADDRPVPDQTPGEPATGSVASSAAGSRQQGAQLGKCRVCSRPLYDPVQAAQGIGPCCAAKQLAGSSSAGPDADEHGAAYRQAQSDLVQLRDALACLETIERRIGRYQPISQARGSLRQVVELLEQELQEAA